MSFEDSSIHDRRNEAIDSALRILDEKGVQSLTLKRIAESMGVSDAALFRHFRNKEDLVESMVARVLADHEVIDHGGDPWEALAEMMIDQLKRFRERPHHTAILFQEELFRHYPEVTAAFLKTKDENRSVLRSILERGMEEGVFHEDLDDDAFILLFMGALRLQVLNWRLSRERDILADADAVLLMLKRTCGADL